MVQYEKAGYLSAQRRLDVRWHGHSRASNVALIPLDTAVTTIDFSEPMQVARGNPVTDADGARQATLLFPQNTKALLTLPDGSKSVLNEINVRATEYSVGETGQEAMPGDLPDATAYTYCVEFTADEAIKADAQIAFDPPVINYLENFIGAPVGTAVPTGYYDPARTVWVPSENGHVIAVTGITAGLADLDTDGDGLADDPAVLEARGISVVERQRLADLYTPGQSLWRVPIDHFTPWDHNWPYGPPEDAIEPDAPTPRRAPREPHSCGGGGSILDYHNQVLGEKIAIPGTDFALHYQSDRSLGSPYYRMEFKLSGSTLPASLVQIRLIIKVAGQELDETFPPTPDLNYLFEWDGCSKHGQVLQGEQNITVKLGYVYPAVYYATSEEHSRAFGQVRARSGGGSGGGGAAWSPTTRFASPPHVTAWNTWEGGIGAWNARSLGVGGWTLSCHHGYDAHHAKLYLGDGQVWEAKGFGPIIETVAGCDNYYYMVPLEGIPATEAVFYDIRGIAAGADGTLYLADRGGQRIRKVDPDGIMWNVAGTGSGWYYDGEGPAMEVSMVPEHLFLGLDGSLYFNDQNYHRIRRIDPSGYLSIFAGNGERCLPLTLLCNEGGLAIETPLNFPRGFAMGLDGNLYLSDWRRVRSVAPNGFIANAAGSGLPCSLSTNCGDGGPAVEADLSYVYFLAVSPDGTLYVVDNNGCCSIITALR